jgi:very-short-patch-repair endonuclease
MKSEKQLFDVNIEMLKKTKEKGWCLCEFQKREDNICPCSEFLKDKHECKCGVFKKINLKDYLYEVYIQNQKPSTEIHLGVNPKTIRRWLKKFDIPTRNKSQAARLLAKNPEYISKKSKTMMGKTHTEDTKNKISLNNTKEKIIINCLNCKNNFFVTPAFKNAKFCCITCFHEYKRITKECVMCGNLFETTKTSNQICCSRKCASNMPNEKNRRKVLTSKMISEGTIAKKRTIPEKIMNQILHSLNMNFIEQKHFGTFTVDFFIPSKKLVIFCDGDYWHANPKFYTKFDKNQQKKKRLDLEHNKTLRKEGYKYLRFWEDDVKNNKNYVINKIKEVK